MATTTEQLWPNGDFIDPSLLNQPLQHDLPQSVYIDRTPTSTTAGFDRDSTPTAESCSDRQRNGPTSELSFTTPSISDDGDFERVLMERHEQLKNILLESCQKAQETLCDASIAGMISLDTAYFLGNQISQRIVTEAPLSDLDSEISKEFNLPCGTEHNSNAIKGNVGRWKRQPQMALSDASDSDASWIEPDCVDAYSAVIESRLDGLPAHQLILRKLSRNQRRALHAQAHLKRLNHLSFGSASSRCMIVSRDVIVTGVEQPRAARCFCRGRRSHVVDLTWLGASVTEDFGPADSFLHTQPISRRSRALGAAEFCAVLQQECLPFPVGQTDSLITFGSLDQIAVVCSKLHDVLTPSGRMKIHFLRRSADQNTGGSMVNAHVTSGSSKILSYLPSPATTAEPIRDIETVELSESSAYSDISLCTDSTSRTSDRKRRKRMPRNGGQYACRYEGCKKSYDRECDRAKHEKFHWPNEHKPHRCQRCGKGFVYPKDLQRHSAVHEPSRGVTAAPSISNIDESPSSPGAIVIEDPTLKEMRGARVNTDSYPHPHPHLQRMRSVVDATTSADPDTVRIIFFSFLSEAGVDGWQLTLQYTYDECLGPMERKLFNIAGMLATLGQASGRDVQEIQEIRNLAFSPHPSNTAYEPPSATDCIGFELSDVSGFLSFRDRSQGMDKECLMKLVVTAVTILVPKRSQLAKCSELLEEWLHEARQGGCI